MNPLPDQTAEKAAATNERKERFTTLGGIPLKTVYTQDALAGPNIENTYGALALGAVLGSLMILRALGIA
jgi:hypothetical protein